MTNEQADKERDIREAHDLASNPFADAPLLDQPQVIKMHDRPLAAAGLKSYRYRGHYGWVMIGAHDDAHALREAARSTSNVGVENLQRWDGQAYVSVLEDGEI